MNHIYVHYWAQFPHVQYPHRHRFIGPYDCQSQEYFIPPPHTATSHPVVRDATFEEAQQQPFIAPSPLDRLVNAEEGGPIGWVPPEERGLQHQSAGSNNSIGGSNEVRVGDSTIDQQPQFASTTFQQASAISNWSKQVQQQQPWQTPDTAIYRITGEAVAFHHQQVQVRDPSDVMPPKASGIFQDSQLSTSMLPAPLGNYPSTSFDLPSTYPPIASQHHRQHLGGTQQAHPQPAVAQGDHDVLHEGQFSHPAYSSTSSGTPSTGTIISPAVSNAGLAVVASPSLSASSTDTLYPVGMYQQTACGSPESMALLNGEIPHHQQAQVPHQPHQEAQSQYLAHHPQTTSSRAQNLHAGLSSSSSPNDTVVVRQPQPFARSSTSSLAAWADLLPTPTVNPEPAPVVREDQGQQARYQHHGQPEVVKEEVAVGVQQVYSPLQQQQQQQQPHPKPRRDQSYTTWEQVKPASPSVPIQPHHPFVLSASTDPAVPRVQAQPPSRSAIVPDMTLSAAQRPSSSGSMNAPAPTRNVTEFDVAPRPVEAIKASETVRRAAKLHINVGQADHKSPASHQARAKARSARRKGSGAHRQSGYSPYHSKPAARRGSSGSQHDQSEHQNPHLRQPIALSSGPSATLQTDRYGAQRTFIFNPYQDPNAVPADGKQGQIPHGVPLPTPCAGASGVVTAVVSGAPAPAPQQTIEFSVVAESMSPDELSKGNAIDWTAAEAAMMVGKKKPFLACGFCRKRKIACGQRAPHSRDGEIGEGHRTCNQCTRRQRLCSFPSKSHRGQRRPKPDTKTVVVEDEDEIEEVGQVTPSKEQSMSKTEVPEWIIAADAWLITPAAWAGHCKAAQEKKASESSNATGPSLGMSIYQSSTFEDALFSAGPSISPTQVYYSNVLPVSCQ